MRLISFFLFFFFSSVAFPRPIELNVRDYGWISSVPPVRDVLDFYLQGVENDLNAEQPLLNPQRLNYGTANSSVLASKGLGTDYVNNPEVFQIGLGIGGAFDGEKNKAIKDEISGAAAASSVTLGFRMEQFAPSTLFGLDAKKIMGYVNFGKLSSSQVIPGEDIDIAGEIETTNFGIHFRYDLLEQKGSEWLGWGGVKLHTGYEYNENRVDLSSEIDESLSVDTGGAGVLTGRLVGVPVYHVETKTHSFPFEISSSVLFLKVFSLYSGFGADMNIGHSKGEGEIKADVTTLACSSGLCAGETELPQLEAEANFDAQSQVKNMTFRAFAGAQIDLPLRLHAYGQVQQMLGTKVIGAAAGLKFTF